MVSGAYRPSQAESKPSQSPCGPSQTTNTTATTVTSTTTATNCEQGRQQEHGQVGFSKTNVELYSSSSSFTHGGKKNRLL